MKTVARIFIIAASFALAVNAQTAPVYTPAETFDQAPAPTAPPVADPAASGVTGATTPVCANIPGATAVPVGLTKDSTGNCVASTSTPAPGTKVPTAPRDLTYLWYGLAALAVLTLIGAVIWFLLKKRGEDDDADDHIGNNHPTAPPAHVPTAPASTLSAPAPAPAPAHHIPGPPADLMTPAPAPAPAPPANSSTSGGSSATTAIISGLLLAGLSLFAPSAQAAGLCDATSIQTFEPAAGYRGQVSRSVAEGSFQNVTGLKFAGTGVTASVTATANMLVVNWSVTPTASLAPKQVQLTCSDSSSKTFPIFFQVAENLQELQHAEKAWAMIPAKLQRIMNAPPAPATTTTRVVVDTRTRKAVTDQGAKLGDVDSRLTRAEESISRLQAWYPDIKDLKAAADKDPAAFRALLAEYAPAGTTGGGIANAELVAMVNGHTARINELSGKVTDVTNGLNETRDHLARTDLRIADVSDNVDIMIPAALTHSKSDVCTAYKRLLAKGKISNTAPAPHGCK